MHLHGNTRTSRSRFIPLIVPAVLLLLPSPSSAQPTISIEEFYLPQPTLPYLSNPWILTPGPDGAIWFTVSCAHTDCVSNPDNEAIGRITADGTITKFPLPFNGKPAWLDGKGPYGITLGSDDALWFTEIRGHAIGRITVSGLMTEYPVPFPPTFPGHGPYAITSGLDGALWFTAGTGIGRITTSGLFTEYPRVTNVSPDTADIVVGPDGALWFTGLNSDRIGRITTEGLITEYPAQSATSSLCGPHGITTGPDGALWFACFSGNRITRITTDGLLTEHPLPGATPRGPIYITTGPDAAFWFTEQYTRTIGRMTTDGVLTEYSIPPGEAPIAITSAPDGIWYGRLGYIGHITITSADTTPPTISGLPTDGCTLWPPNGGFAEVAHVTATDDESGVAPGSLVVTLKSNEPSQTRRPDWKITDDGSGGIVIDLRAARRGNGKGRIYTLTATAADQAGNVARVTATCTVPHDRGR